MHCIQYRWCYEHRYKVFVLKVTYPLLSSFLSVRMVCNLKPNIHGWKRPTYVSPKLDGLIRSSMTSILSIEVMLDRGHCCPDGFWPLHVECFWRSNQSRMSSSRRYKLAWNVVSLFTGCGVWTTAVLPDCSQGPGSADGHDRHVGGACGAPEEYYRCRQRFEQVGATVARPGMVDNIVVFALFFTTNICQSSTHGLIFLCLVDFDKCSVESV